MSANKRRAPARKLRIAATAELRDSLTIPTRWLKTAIGLFLLPLAAVLTQSFFTCFSRATIQNGLWATEEFWFFSLGAVLWTIAFYGLPRPILIYVFGHELTHALWVVLMGGSVKQFSVSSHGGYIVTNKHNFWIALAPYFFPLYSIGVIALYGVLGLFYDLLPYRQLLYGLIGATWGFHVSFTLWMIPKGQTDLTYHGTFFSLVVIYSMNVIILSALLILASPDVTWLSFGGELVENAAAMARWLTDTFFEGL